MLVYIYIYIYTQFHTDTNDHINDTYYHHHHSIVITIIIIIIIILARPAAAFLGRPAGEIGGHWELLKPWRHYTTLYDILYTILYTMYYVLYTIYYILYTVLAHPGDENCAFQAKSITYNRLQYTIVNHHIL